MSKLDDHRLVSADWPEPDPAEFFARIHQATLMLDADRRAALEVWETDEGRSSEWPGWAGIVPGWEARQERLTR